MSWKVLETVLSHLKRKNILGLGALEALIINSKRLELWDLEWMRREGGRSNH